VPMLPSMPSAPVNGTELISRSTATGRHVSSCTEDAASTTHFPWLDEPEVFFPLVLAWLARV
jgi:hypothetical protein